MSYISLQIFNFLNRPITIGKFRFVRLVVVLVMCRQDGGCLIIRR
jgi:hypothetical protein